MHKSQVLFYLTTALHVSGVTISSNSSTIAAANSTGTYIIHYSIELTVFFAEYTLFNNCNFNLLAPEFYIEVLSHPVCKMWIIQEPKKVALWNKRHFEDKNWVCAACLKYSVFIFVEKKYKMQHLEGSGTPVLYIGRTVLKG
jgi:hypothetical protein